MTRPASDPASTSAVALFVHWCSGKPDEIVSAKLIDFEPREW